MITSDIEKKSWLVDVPVAINFFARPEALSRSFSVIKQARPSMLFLISDGPRKEVPSDVENVRRCREIVEDINWDCKVYKFYADKNKGLFHTYFDAMEQVFNIVDRCIFLEDDIIVSLSFFQYCKELLEKYENDLRIHFITGMNLMEEYDKPDGDYFFSGEGSIWGYALWKRTFESMNLNFRNNPYAIEMTKRVARQIKPGYEKKIDKCVENPNWEGHIPHVEFYKNYLRFSENQMYIVPKKNMICNVGVGSNAVHSADNLKKLPRATQRLFDMKTYEFEFPLKAPEFVIRDLYYEEFVNKSLAWNDPIRTFMRRIEALIRHLMYGDFNRVGSKIRNINKKSEKE